MDEYPRPFKLIRHTDVTGVSGTGFVAEGVQFSDGRVALRWTGSAHASTVIWDSIEDAIAIHGHDGATEVVWIKAAIDAQFHPDEDEEPLHVHSQRCAGELTYEGEED